MSWPFLISRAIDSLLLLSYITNCTSKQKHSQTQKQQQQQERRQLRRRRQHKLHGWKKNTVHDDCQPLANMKIMNKNLWWFFHVTLCMLSDKLILYHFRVIGVSFFHGFLSESVKQQTILWLFLYLGHVYVILFIFLFI